MPGSPINSRKHTQTADWPSHPTTFSPARTPLNLASLPGLFQNGGNPRFTFLLQRALSLAQRSSHPARFYYCQTVSARAGLAAITSTLLVYLLNTVAFDFTTHTLPSRLLSAAKHRRCRSRTTTPITLTRIGELQLRFASHYTQTHPVTAAPFTVSTAHARPESRRCSRNRDDARIESECIRARTSLQWLRHRNDRYRPKHFF